MYNSGNERPGSISNNGYLLLITGKRLVLLTACWPIVFIPICFALFYSLHSRSAFDDDAEQTATISAAGAKVPESIILTYGLHVEAVLFLFFFAANYIAYDSRISALSGSVGYPDDTLSAMSQVSSSASLRDSKSGDNSIVENVMICGCCCCNRNSHHNSLIYWNKVSLGLGLVAAFCMGLVGSVTLTTETNLHGFAAFFMFLSGILHMLINYFRLRKFLTVDAWTLRLHQISLFVCIPFNILMYFIALVILITCDSYQCRGYIVDINSALEFSTALAILLYIYSFVEEIGPVDLMQVVSRHAHHQLPSSPVMHSSDAVSNTAHQTHLAEADPAGIKFV